MRFSHKTLTGYSFLQEQESYCMRNWKSVISLWDCKSFKSEEQVKLEYSSVCIFSFVVCFNICNMLKKKKYFAKTNHLAHAEAASSASGRTTSSDRFERTGFFPSWTTYHKSYTDDSVEEALPQQQSTEILQVDPMQSLKPLGSS